jgi:hypothetical protein
MQAAATVVRRMMDFGFMGFDGNGVIERKSPGFGTTVL